MAVGQNQWSRAGEWYAAGLFLVYAGIVLVHRGAPSLTDYANWTYQGVLLREHVLRHPDAAHALKHYPVPNSLTTIGIGACSLVLPWLAAAKLWLVVQLALCFACLRALLRAIDAPAVAWVVVPQAVFLNVNFWYGFMNFELGLAWVMLFAAMLLHHARPWKLMLTLVLVFLTHMIPYCFCVLLLGLHSVQTGRLRRMWVAIPSVALTLWYVLGRFLYAGNADGQAGMKETVRNYGASFWLFKVNSYLKSFGFVNPMGLDQSVFGKGPFVGLLVANSLLAGLVAWGIVQGVLFARRQRTDRGFLWLGLCCLLPVFLLAPGAALGISDPGARVLQTGLALGTVLCWTHTRAVERGFAAFCAGMLAIGGVALFLACGGSQSPPPCEVAERAGRFEAFAHVVNDDQNYFYRALQDGRTDLPVFPTGMFLNRQQQTTSPHLAR